MTPRLSVIVLQYNKPDLTRECLWSFFDLCGMRHEVILVDNASTDPQAAAVAAEFPPVRLLRRPTNDGFGAGNNAGAQGARGDILLFLNNDTVCTMDLASPVLEFFDAHPEVGIVGPRLLNRDGSLQLSCGALPSIGREVVDKVIAHGVDRRWNPALAVARRAHASTGRRGWVTGAALFIRAELFRSLKGFDPAYFMFFEDKDLCLRAAHAGSEVWHYADASVMHLRGSSTNERTNAYYRASQRYYYQCHRPPWERWLLRQYHRQRGWETDGSSR